MYFACSGADGWDLVNQCILEGEPTKEGAFRLGASQNEIHDMIYIRVQPTWIRYSDYNRNPRQITEFDVQALLPA